MATNTVQIKIAEVGAQQAAKDTKSLKQQIKDLRLELEQLTPETEEYNEKIQQMGELMHRQTELTEQAKNANGDLGQSYSNLSAMAQGMVGSFAAVQGIMNSVGLSTSGTEEAIKQMTSLMAIMQGLSSLDKAEKAFKGFTTRIKNNTTALFANTAAQKANSNAAKEDAASMGTATKATQAQGNAAATAAVKTNLLATGFKNLGRSIKSFAMSNPLTLLLVTLTTAYTLISNFIDKQKESKKEFEEMRDAATSAMTVYSDLGLTADDRKARATSFAAEFDKYYNNNSERFQRLKKLGEIENLLTRVRENLKKNEFVSAGDLDDLHELELSEKDLYGIELKLIETRAELNVLRMHQIKLDKQHSQLTDAEKEKLNEYEEGLYSLSVEYDNKLKERAEKEKERRANAAKAREEAMNRELEIIKNTYEKEKLLNERSLKENEITQSEYYANLLGIHERYSDAYDNWVKKYRKQKENELEIERNTDTELAIIRQQAEQRIKLYDEANNPKNTIAAQLAERQRNEAQRELELSRATNQAIADDVAETARKTNEIYNAWWLKKMVLIDQFSREEVEREREKNEQILQYQYDLKAEEQEILTGNRNADVENETAQYLHDLEVEKQKLDANLILKEEYDKKVEEMEREHQERLQAIDSQFDTDYQKVEDEKTEILRDIQENRYQMELEYFNRRMELEKAYIDAFSTIYGQITSLLGEVQNGYEEGTKQYEQIAETMLIMQTIESAMAGFKSGVEAPIPAPGNFVLGGILAALATATGIASISNLKNKKLSSAVGNASININPYETLSTQTNAELLGQIADSRCYVLEQDITSTVNRVSVTEQEASF